MRPETALVLLAALVAPLGVHAAEPWRPSDSSLVLERLPAAGDPALRALGAAVRADPHDLAAAAALADHYLDLGRARQDTRFMGYAQAALAPWWDLEEPPVAVRLVRADLLQHRHDFLPALAELDRVLEADRRNPRAWLARAQILMVLGRPLEAEESCRPLARLRQPFAAAICSANSMAATGRAGAAAVQVEAALERHAGAEPALRAWGLATLAEIAACRGAWSEARRHYEEASALDPADSWTVVALADLLIRQSEPEAAMRLVDGDRRHDGKLLRLALATRAAGGDASAMTATLTQRFAAGAARGDAVTQREEAMLRLELTGEPARALALAAENWQRQREVVDARLLLASALAAGEPGAAAPVLAWIAETGIEDARLEPLRRRLAGGAG